MAKKDKTLDNGNIKVTFDDDDMDVTSEAVTQTPASSSFTILKTLGNIFFFTKGSDHRQVANQKAQFKKEVTLEIPLTTDVLNNPAMQGKTSADLTVVYYDKNKEEWFEFANQTLDMGNYKSIVKLNSWIKDPPVGWGISTT